MTPSHLVINLLTNIFLIFRVPDIVLGAEKFEGGRYRKKKIHFFFFRMVKKLENTMIAASDI